jgi:class 3 adenylate cyclase/HAMP domain-containing protein
VDIRPKFILAVLPLVIAPLVLVGLISTLSARTGITAVAADLLRFKAEQLATYAQGQWDLLAANGLEATPSYVEAAKAAVESFARSLVRSPTESIFAIDAAGGLAMRTGENAPGGGDLPSLSALAGDQASGWRTVRVGTEERVGHLAPFRPFGWTFFVTERAAAFYRPADAIVLRTAYVLAGSLVAAVLLLVLLTRLLTRPLREISEAMTEIVSTNDLSRRVAVLYGDETGRLGHTFNLMSEQLGKAYTQIKNYAAQAAVARIKEQKIRTIFQKYVPRAVIEQFFASPEKMLEGEDRVLAVLFSDVRDFTSISERMQPEQMVESLNRYFSTMVDIIMNRGGIVDKYIGDAVMAVFGAPVRHADDALQSATAALEMLEALDEFNAWQKARGRAPFRIGVGINYGNVTVGNIGSDRKMDYTVIGDMVNLASRLEGLTKKYGVPFVVSESMQRKIADTFPCRLLGKVSVKGRSAGTGIYEVRRSLDDALGKAWALHAEACALYYARKFGAAEKAFRGVLQALPGDVCAGRLAARSAGFAKSPPPPAWTGVEEITEK